MSQQQPTWASPQQPDGEDTPRRKRSIGKIAGIWLGSAVGLFVLLGVIGEATGAGKSTNASASTSPSPTKASATPTRAAKTTAPAKPKPSAAPVKTAAPAKAAATSTPAPKLATAEARKKAAAILEQEDQSFRDFLAKGEDVVGTPQFSAWYQKATVGLDMKQTAFSNADANFTADNEPTDLLDDWRWNNGNADGAISTFAMDGTSPDAPNAKTRKDASDCLADLAKADKDAEKIGNGS
jgi:hypothetical protein